MLPLWACALVGAGASRGEGDAAKADLKAEPQTDPTPEAKPPKSGAPLAPPLSAEDAALVRELALLEQVDLLKNLELFERDDSMQQPRRQP